MIISEKYNLEKILYEISFANEDEWDATKKYSHLLNVLQNYDIFDDRITVEFINKAILEINDYISEELKHSKGLTRLYTELSGIIAED